MFFITQYLSYKALSYLDIFWIVVGAGGCILTVGEWWRMVVDVFWLVVGGGGWLWVVVDIFWLVMDGGGWWWVVA